MIKKLRCKFCGEEINVPYNENLDGRVYHPKCYGKSFEEKFKNFVRGSK